MIEINKLILCIILPFTMINNINIENNDNTISSGTRTYNSFLNEGKLKYYEIFSTDNYIGTNNKIYTFDMNYSTNIIEYGNGDSVFIPSQGNETKVIDGRSYNVDSKCKLQYIFICKASKTEAITHQSQIVKHYYGLDSETIEFEKGKGDESYFSIAAGNVGSIKTNVGGAECEIDFSVKGVYSHVYGTENLVSWKKEVNKNYPTGYYFIGAVSTMFTIKKVEVTVYHVRADSIPASKTQSGLPAYNGYYYEFADYRLEDVDRAIVKGEYSLSLFRYTDYLEKKECMEMK